MTIFCTEKLHKKGETSISFFIFHPNLFFKKFEFVLIISFAILLLRERKFFWSIAKWFFSQNHSILACTRNLTEPQQYELLKNVMIFGIKSPGALKKNSAVNPSAIKISKNQNKILRWWG